MYVCVYEIYTGQIKIHRHADGLFCCVKPVHCNILDVVL